MQPVSIALLLTAAVSAAALQPAANGEPAEPQRWITNHSLELSGQRVEFEARVASITLRTEREEPVAELFYTAYFRTNAPDGPRPLVFAYNGGPGSASFWLHMGIMGPKRIVTPNVGQQAPPPYPIEDNRYCLLDIADIVMVDPVGTGFSRPVGDVEGEQFWGLDEDASSLAQFIRRFLNEHERWNSPRYLLGESYGTTRSALLARQLQRSNIDLNGIVLVSAVLDFNTITFPEGSIVPYVVNVPSYALVAAYHGAGRKPKDRAKFLAEVEQWATTDYAAALLAGSNLRGERRRHVIRQMHDYTGLSEDYLDRANLRVSAPEFEQELMRQRGLVVGRLDARFTGPSGDRRGRRPSHDPQSSAISSAYTSAFNTYLRTDLGYDGDREYVPSGMARPWNWERRSAGGGSGFGFASTPNVAPVLAEAITRNPELQVLLVNGVYDLATPYFAAVWAMDNLNLPDHLRDNIQRADFDAGHMMYVEQELLPQWRRVLADFIGRTSGR